VTQRDSLGFGHDAALLSLLAVASLTFGLCALARLARLGGAPGLAVSTKLPAQRDRSGGSLRVALRASDACRAAAPGKSHPPLQTILPRGGLARYTHWSCTRGTRAAAGCGASDGPGSPRKPRSDWSEAEFLAEGFAANPATLKALLSVPAEVLQGWNHPLGTSAGCRKFPLQGY
jgi:hypothetical protein